MLLRQLTGGLAFREKPTDGTALSVAAWYLIKPIHVASIQTENSLAMPWPSVERRSQPRPAITSAPASTNNDRRFLSATDHQAVLGWAQEIAAASNRLSSNCRLHSRNI